MLMFPSAAPNSVTWPHETKLSCLYFFITIDLLETDTVCPLVNTRPHSVSSVLPLSKEVNQSKAVQPAVDHCKRH